MATSWRRLTQRLRQPRGTQLATALAGQMRAARDGAIMAQSMVDKRISPAEARLRMGEIEHHGDELRRHLVESLSRTLVTPLDREDLFRLSRCIDDVLDTLRDFVREADLYQIENRRSYRPLLDNAVQGIDALDHAIQVLWTNPRQAPIQALAVKKAAARINRGYQREMATIVDNLVSAYSFKHRELLGRLARVGDQLNGAADVLTDGALKRGY